MRKVSLVNQRCALESVVWAFLPQVIPSNLPQLLVYKWDERLQGLVIPGPPLAQEGADRLGRGFCHSHTVRSTKDLKLTCKTSVRDVRSQFRMLQACAWCDPSIALSSAACRRQSDESCRNLFPVHISENGDGPARCNDVTKVFVLPAVNLEDALSWTLRLSTKSLGRFGSYFRLCR
jgi:hypothetical protein